MTEVGGVSYPGFDNYYKTSHTTWESMEAYIYQPKYSQSSSTEYRWGGKDSSSLILYIGRDGTIEPVSMTTDWQSAVSGITFAITAIAATTMLAF